MLKKNPAIVQLKLFGPTIIKSAYLEADSPRKAFWHIELVFDGGKYHVIKKSGSRGKINDVRTWSHEDLESSRRDYDKRLKSKLNPNRKSKRKYHPAKKI